MTNLALNAWPALDNHDGMLDRTRRYAVLWTPLAVLALDVVLLAGCGDDRADPSCYSAAECRDGLLCVGEGEVDPGACTPVASEDTGDVFTDPATSLEWQVTPAVESMDWESARIHCERLELDGGGWRLPSIGELRSLIRGCPATETGGPCQVTDECLSFDACETAECEGCVMDGGPAGGCYWPDELEGGCARFQWSSSTEDENLDRAFYVIFNWGHVSLRTKSFFFGLVRCVRAG